MSLSHIDKQNQPHMVDVSDKAVTKRTAVASASMHLGEAIFAALKNGDILTPKGPVFQTAIVAGTMAVKRTSDFIPMCHPLPVEGIDFSMDCEDGHCLRITCRVSVTAKTGVEMEALTGVTAAALTVYDMCKSVSRNMIIKEIKLLEKTGGKSDYTAS